MKKFITMEKDNISEVLRVALESYNVKISRTSIQDCIKSHYAYPSMLSISDALKRWKIQHMSLKLTMDEIMEVQEPFIGHINTQLGPKFVFVVSYEKDRGVKYYDEAKTYKLARYEDFVKQFSGACIFIEPDENSGEYDYRLKRQNEFLDKVIPYVLLPAVLGLGIYLIAKSYPLQLHYYLILMSYILGVFFSYLLVKKDLKFTSGLSDFLCGLGTNTSCNDILNTNASKLVGWIGWSEFGMVYFLTGFFTLLFLPISGTLFLLKILSYISLGYVIYSISYQALIERRWCTLCLLVQFVLIVQFILQVIIGIKYYPLFNSLLLYILVGLFSLSILLVKGLIIKRQKIREINPKYLYFKRDPLITKTLIQHGKKMVSPNINDAICIDQEDAKITVTAFISLHCNPCSKAFNSIYDIYANRKANLRLIFSAKEEDYRPVAEYIHYAKEGRHDDIMNSLKHWYSNGKNHKKLNGKETIPVNLEEFKTFKEKHISLMKELEVEGTPTLRINGYDPPDPHDFEEFANLVDSIYINDIELD